MSPGLKGFEGFDEFDLSVRGTTIHGRVAGSGSPLLLLHGIPETHLMWHRVAPALTEQHTIVVTDLRGYGASGTPPSTDDHAPYSMREIAADQVEVMRRLGHERFGVAGHDRGARCAYRMALDHPDVVTRLAVLDIVPTGTAFARAGRAFSLGYWVWSFLAAPCPVPETLIAADPAAATLDFEHDQADHGRVKIAGPVLAVWSDSGAVAEWYEPLEVWRELADDVRGGPVAAGHFLPEEAPEETIRQLRDFFN